MKPITFSGLEVERVILAITETNDGIFFLKIMDLIANQANIPFETYSKCIGYLERTCGLMYSGPLSNLMSSELKLHESDEKYKPILESALARADHLYDIYDTPQ